MQNYPTDIDFGFIKQFISTIPAKHFVESSENNNKNSPQDLVDYNYDTLLYELMTEINCKVFDTDKKTTYSQKDISNFISSSLKTDRLQRNNILLSSNLWKQVTLALKTNISNDCFQKTIDEDLKRLNFSELSAVSHNRNQTISYPTLTTIQFDFKQMSSDEAKQLNEVSQFYFDTLFSKCATEESPYALYNTASHALDFSIHKYYLPNGISSQQTSDACLLFRYDHCPIKHKNGAMPLLYKNVYPEFVAEPHFHFTSGFGSIYKLTNKNEEHTFGVGYAIGVSGLKDYIGKILKNEYSSEEEQCLYTENDFGMPFLSMLKEERYPELIQVYEGLDVLQQAYESKDQELELQAAYGISNAICNTEQKDLLYLPNNNQNPFEDAFSQ